jgi:hypothetical protein
MFFCPVNGPLAVSDARVSHLRRVPIMKKILAALIVSLAIPLATCHAHGDGISIGTCGTISYGFRIKVSGCLRWSPGGCSSCSSCCGSGNGCGYGAAPWYSYWPLEAHFQVPAPTGYPYWPSPMGSMMNAPAAYGYTPGVHQVGYYGPAPSYWYGN